MYAEYAPTQFDPRGLNLPDRQDWIVLPCSQTRDSEAATRANFKAALAMAEDAGFDVETHRFGHWGPGWVEIILVAPSEAATAFVEDMERGLEDYPILDEHAWAEEELEDQIQSIQNCYLPQITRAIENAIWGAFDVVDEETVRDLCGYSDTALEAALAAAFEGDEIPRFADKVAGAVDQCLARWRNRPCEPRSQIRYFSRFGT